MHNHMKNENKGDDAKNKEVTIIVNTREKQVTQKYLTFEDVLALAFDNPPTGPNIMMTIQYRRGHGSKPSGSLVQGKDPVKVKKGMIFDVTPTDKS